MTKLVFVAAASGAVVAALGALNITGMRGLPTKSVFVQLEGYFIVILFTEFT